jgi:hypothetical protein
MMQCRSRTAYRCVQSAGRQQKISTVCGTSSGCLVNNMSAYGPSAQLAMNICSMEAVCAGDIASMRACWCCGSEGRKHNALLPAHIAMLLLLSHIHQSRTSPLSTTAGYCNLHPCSATLIHPVVPRKPLPRHPVLTACRSRSMCSSSMQQR